MSDRLTSKLLHIDGRGVQLTEYDQDFILIHAIDGNNLNQVGRSIFEYKSKGIEEVIVTPNEICLKINSTFDTDDIKSLSQIKLSQETHSSTWKIPVCFEAENDWALVEDHTGCSKDQVIKKIIEAPISVGMFGFIPGFVYFDGLPEDIHVPRKKVPSKYVEPNSIAIGGGYLGIYSLPSPGGWNVIGRMPISILQIPEIPPVKLQLNDRIQFEAISKELYTQLVENKTTLEEYNA